MKGLLNIEKTLIPDYVLNLNPYQAGKSVEELAREKGLSRISKLASNENPLGPSPLALQELKSGINCLHRYPDMYSFQLKSALAKHYQIKLDNIILGNGSEGIMADIMRTFVVPGDEVVSCEKTFIGFTNLAKGVGANLIKVPLTSDYRFDVEGLARAISPKSRILYIANPNNPTGTYISEKEFDFLMENIPDHCLVILDEAYFEFSQTKFDFPNSMNYRYDNVITLRTFSKAYGLAGIRIGYGLAHSYLISNLSKIKLPFGPNTLAQLAALGALNDHQHLQKTLENNLKIYPQLLEFLHKYGLNPIPSVTNFITFSTPSEKAALWLFQNLLEQGVIIRPLKSNEMPEFLRVSIGTEEEVNHFFEAMNNVKKDYCELHQN